MSKLLDFKITDLRFALFGLGMIVGSQISVGNRFGEGTAYVAAGALLLIDFVVANKKQQ